MQNDAEELKRIKDQLRLGSSQIGKFTQLTFEEKLRKKLGISDAKKQSRIQGGYDAEPEEFVYGADSQVSSSNYLSKRDRVRFHLPGHDLDKKLDGARPCWGMQRGLCNSSAYGQYSTMSDVPVHKLYYWPKKSDDN